MSRTDNHPARQPFRAAAFAMGFAGVLAVGGCASDGYQAATHHWVSFDQVSGIEYRVDNNQCARETLGESGPRVLETNTVAYEQYVSCMNEKGYVLTAYSDQQPPR